MAVSITFPIDCWMGLAVRGTEVTDAGYVRMPASFEAVVPPALAANVATVQWPPCGASWGLIDSVNLYDALTGGDLLGSAPAVTAVQANRYDMLRVQAGGCELLRVTHPLGYGTFTFGTGRYATYDTLTADEPVLLLKTWRPAVPCEPGTWTPAAPCETGAWAPPSLCKPGNWQPGPLP